MKIPDPKDSVVISAAIPKTLQRWAKDYAKSKRITFSELIRWVLEERQSKAGKT